MKWTQKTWTIQFNQCDIKKQENLNQVIDAFQKIPSHPENTNTIIIFKKLKKN